MKAARTSAGAVLEMWQQLAGGVVAGRLEACQGLFPGLDRTVSANRLRIGLGYVASAWNLAIAISEGDEALRAMAAAFARGCAEETRYLTSAVDAALRGAKDLTRRQHAILDDADRTFAEAARAARDLIRLRVGDEREIRDVSDLTADAVAALAAAAAALAQQVT